MKQIPLTKDKFATVDDDIFIKLSKYKWFFQSSGRNHGYAARRKNNKIILMHRLILNIIDTNFEGDHINGNTLDNRRINLRSVTHAQNIYNKIVNKTNICGYKGVQRWGNKYRARIYVNGKATHLGLFFTSIEAARAYDRAAKYYFSVFAKLNFPDNNMS